MIAKTGKWVMASGYVPKDAEYRLVGEGQYPLTRFGIKVDEVKDGNEANAKWVNCECWRDTAEIAKRIEKGDSVFVIGTMKMNEYEGKIYKNLLVEFLSIQGKISVNIIEDNSFDVPAGFEPVDGEEDLQF